MTPRVTAIAIAAMPKSIMAMKTCQSALTAIVARKERTISAAARAAAKRGGERSTAQPAGMPPQRLAAPAGPLPPEAPGPADALPGLHLRRVDAGELMLSII